MDQLIPCFPPKPSPNYSGFPSLTNKQLHDSELHTPYIFMPLHPERLSPFVYFPLDAEEKTICSYSLLITNRNASSTLTFGEKSQSNVKNIFIIISYIFSVCIHYNHRYNKYRSAKQAIITVAYGMRGTGTQGYYITPGTLSGPIRRPSKSIERKRNRNMIKTVSAANSRMSIKAMDTKKNSETRILLKLEAEERLQKPVPPTSPVHATPPCLVLVFFTCHVPSPVPSPMPTQALLGTHLTPHKTEIRSCKASCAHTTALIPQW